MYLSCGLVQIPARRFLQSEPTNSPSVDSDRADALQQRLSAAEIELESNQRHVGVLKRAIRALPRGLQVLNELDQLVAEELQPLRDRLRDAVLELEVARAQVGLSCPLHDHALHRCCRKVPSKAVWSSSGTLLDDHVFPPFPCSTLLRRGVTRVESHQRLSQAVNRPAAWAFSQLQTGCRCLPRCHFTIHLGLASTVSGLGQV